MNNHGEDQPETSRHLRLIPGEALNLPLHDGQINRRHLGFVLALEQAGLEGMALRAFLTDNPSATLSTIATHCSDLLRKYSGEEYDAMREDLIRTMALAESINALYLDCRHLLIPYAKQNSVAAIEIKKKLQLAVIDNPGINDTDKDACLEVIDHYSPEVRGLDFSNPDAAEEYRRSFASAAIEQAQSVVVSINRIPNYQSRTPPPPGAA